MQIRQLVKAFLLMVSRPNRSALIEKMQNEDLQEDLDMQINIVTWGIEGSTYPEGTGGMTT